MVHDKNGKRLYKGDKVIYGGGSSTGVIDDIKSDKAHVQLDNGGYGWISDSKQFEKQNKLSKKEAVEEFGRGFTKEVRRANEVEIEYYRSWKGNCSSLI